MNVQVVVKSILEEISNKLLYTHPIERLILVLMLLGNHILRAQFCLCLALKGRFDHLKTDGSNNPGANVRIVKVLRKMLLNDTCYRLSKGREMRPPLGCILTINKAIKLFSVLVDMGNSHLYII